ncbi:MAG: helix-turn-helix domain-containing protein [Candidatus Coprovivens sp.]
MNQEKIGKFILKCRNEKKLTQQELADKLGVTNKAISKWENGRGMPDYSIFHNLCKELDISVIELLNGEKNKNEEKIITEYIDFKEKKLKKIILL